MVVRTLNIHPPAFYFSWVTRDWTQGLSLTRQVLYHMYHEPIIWILMFFQKGCCAFPCVQLRPWSFYLFFPSSGDYRDVLTCLAYFWNRALLTVSQNGLKPWSSYISISQVAGITKMHPLLFSYKIYYC